jgi:sortase (surface protein transpeptidase)
LKHASRLSLVVPFVAGVLAASGAIAIGVAIAGQQDAPQPPRSAAGSLERNAEAAATPVPHSSPRPAQELALPSSKPVAIDIPAIGVHSVIQFVGLTSEHTLQVPAPGPHYNEAAWYKYSSTPGSTGPAVIVGHVDSAAEGPSVFFDLGDLRPEDKVLVTRADGIVAVFTVDGVRSYPKDAFPTKLVYGKDEHAVLRLVTCGGPFDDSSGHYLDNIVVFASLVGSQ